MISTPICDFVQAYASSGVSRFHMPGHKGAEVLPGLSMQADITEISGADCLYTADGIILESERNASLLFGTGATFYSTEGSSQCIRAMLALVIRNAAARTKDRPVILAARNVHRAFLTAAALLDLEVEWLYPQAEPAGSVCSCPVSAEQVRRALSDMACPPAAVYLTSPDYLGRIQNIREIAEAAHSYGVPLLVDNAHGAYLHFLEQPAHPMDLGADICCDSAHKTLPALTGCAYLHISKKAAPVYAAHARKALSLFGSTSPSWLLLESLDYTNKVLAGGFRSRLSDCISRVTALKRSFPGIMDTQPGPAQLPGEWLMEEPLKITIRASSMALTGTQLAKRLRTYGIECEYADPDDMVLMVSPYNTSGDMDRLEAALRDILSTWSKSAAGPLRILSAAAPAHPQKTLSIREAALAPSRKIPAEQAAGQICTDLSLSCPPGIPVVICGEVITDEAIRMLKYYGIREIEVLAGT